MSDNRPKPEQDKETGRFLAGNSGNGGRKRGSRNKLGEEFLSALYEDFSENGPTVIEQVRTEKPDVYLKVVASLLPKELNVSTNPLDDVDDDELQAMIEELRKQMAGHPQSSNRDDTKH